MSDYVFSPEPTQGLPVVGSKSLFPVRRVYCVGRNYAEHAKEMGFTGREDPFFFCKPADALVSIAAGQAGKMSYPSKTSNLHYEMELVVALGSGGRDIAVDQANKCIFGYALGLDMTRRDLQNEAKKQGRPWEVGKGFDQSGPIGPIHPIAATGVLPIRLQQVDIDLLSGSGPVRASDTADSLSPLNIKIDLQASTVQAVSSPTAIRFSIDPFWQECLMKGLDEIDLTLSYQSSIDAFESAHLAGSPWLTHAHK